tara:strand:+ start:30914 stop:31177 length:264 start_codon:yes stop_codon:yes gene_type:complete
MEEVEDYLFLNRPKDVIRFIDNHYCDIKYDQVKELLTSLVIKMILDTIVIDKLGGFWNDDTKSCYYTTLEHYESKLKEGQNTERSCC